MFGIKFLRGILVFIALGLGCCGTPISKEEQEMEAIEAEEVVLKDTLQIIEGAIPDEWVKVPLENGYYIGYPKKPRKKKKRKLTDWKLRRNKYQIYTSLTDLSQEESFEDNKYYRASYYQAIAKDLAKDMEGEIHETSLFLSQGIYEGQRTTIMAEDVTVYMQSVIIGKDLYTVSLILWVQETPAYIQMREKLFHSFGKDLYILEQE